ncbi:hypothetical protein OHA72_38995 [Dactylosporangium sp. NBC_01737]|uniref:hypothetical protein n=1 Tax=Dactylosporangium sp. NBC_01737 TaxID=2975959 RepID=UPI002E0F9A05|nr:hypothetical protein OHA72_38995 [Dactylosporangium sp. NBC_01737]
MTGIDDDLVRGTLRHLADDVELRDLRPQVLRTSRRLTVRRRVTATTAVAVLLVSGGVALHGAGPGGRDTVLPGISAGPASQAPPTGSPAPLPGSTGQANASTKIGTVYFVEDGDAVPQDVLRLVSWTPGQTQVTALRTLPRSAWRSVNVAPDGRSVSWVEGDTGPLHVADLRAGGQETVIPDLTVDGLLLEPVWARDSKHLLVRSTAGKAGVVDVDRRTFTPLGTNLPADARHAAYAADGSSIAFVTAAGAVVVVKPDGSGQRAVPGLDKLPLNGRRITGVQSLSVGYGDVHGQWVHLYAATPDRAGDDGRSLLSNLTVNTLEGRQVSEAGGIGEFEDFQSTFRNYPGLGNSAQLLWRIGTPAEFALKGPNGEFLDGSEPPAALRHYRMLNV